MSGTIATVDAADEDRAIDTIVVAFAADPMARWVWPDVRQYLTSMPAFARAFGGEAFTRHTSLCTEDLAGVALWLPPGAAPDDEVLGALVDETVAVSRRAELQSVMGEMGLHHPAEPHWYLPLIGVDPARQGQGHGSALMTRALERCDEQHLPAYLESSNPRNISLYRRHGFEQIGTIQIGTSPPVVPMLRRAR